MKVITSRDNPDIVSGIHNYCDKWCQRCEMTRRCAVYAMEEAEVHDAGDGDADNEVFWGKIAESLTSAMEMLRDMADQAGVDLDAVDWEAEKERQGASQREVHAHPLVRSAQEYMSGVEKWFDALETRASTGHLDVNPSLDELLLKDMIDVIIWYHTVIPTKLSRAVWNVVEGNEEFFSEDESDAQGSAKVALICIERSMAAWWRILGLFPDCSGQIKKFLMQLDRLRRETDKAVPLARSFQRPGFDFLPAR
ncbi:MAG: hypothetical protein EA399_07980 [Desulfovibrionales bacterium]|nr:MAG: hypothetical protein EA399_07980 [Desulfovibrionales bacterium]